ncbi:MAG: hypothetical protein AAB215_05860 [Planctomycetota bacterium]
MKGLKDSTDVLTQKARDAVSRAKGLYEKLPVSVKEQAPAIGERLQVASKHLGEGAYKEALMEAGEFSVLAQSVMGRVANLAQLCASVAMQDLDNARKMSAEFLASSEFQNRILQVSVEAVRQAVENERRLASEALKEQADAVKGEVQGMMERKHQALLADFESALEKSQLKSRQAFEDAQQMMTEFAASAKFHKMAMDGARETVRDALAKERRLAEEDIRATVAAIQKEATQQIQGLRSGLLRSFEVVLQKDEGREAPASSNRPSGKAKAKKAGR